MVLAMAGFALEDMAIKMLSATLPSGQILVSIGLGGSVVFLASLKPSDRRMMRHVWRHPNVMLRNCAELIGTMAFVTVLALAALAPASAIIQANPLIVTAGAVLVFGEKVGLHRWGAVIVGLFGVVLIIRPWASDFDPALLLAVVAMLALATRDLATRRVPREIPDRVLATFAFMAVVPAGLALMLAGVGGAPSWPSVREWLWLGFGVGFGMLAYWAITASLRAGEMSVIASFRYSRIVFATLIALFVFGERPDPLVWAGMAIVIASGLYTLMRERRALEKRGATR
ncbi:DMT family transporter [Rhodobacteraceae bacterium ASV31]|nr:DMT family transporter [Anianabacter salinae]